MIFGPDLGGPEHQERRRAETVCCPRANDDSRRDSELSEREKEMASAKTDAGEERVPKDLMTPKERWLAVLRRQRPDRVPTDYWTTDEAQDKLKKYLGCPDEDSMYKRLHIDKKITVEPEYVGPKVASDADVYGCRFKEMDYGA